jgi:hypothetical protein
VLQASPVKLFLPAEVIGNAGDVDVRRLGNFADRSAVIALLAETPDRRGDELLAGGGAGFLFVSGVHDPR